MTTENTQQNLNSIIEVKQWLSENPNYRTAKGNLNSNLHKMLPEQIRHNLYNVYGDIILPAQIFCVEHNLLSPPICEVCKTAFALFTGKKFAVWCSLQCARKHKTTIEKRKETTLNRYGVDNVSKSPPHVAKRNATNLSRYKSINPASNIEVKSKISQTLKEQYRKDKNTEIEKRQTTMHKRFNGHSSASNTVKEKKKKTCIEKYGTEVAASSPLVIQNIKNTMIQRYNVESAFQLPHVLSQTQQRNIEKSHQSQIDFLQLLDGIDTESLTIREISEKIGISISGVTVQLVKQKMPWKHDNSRSSIELEICSFLSDHGVKYETSNRSILSGKELDIYLPEFKLAIEVNGVYWHSEKFKNKNYHAQKTADAEQCEIQIFHIMDIEWNDYVKRNIWKSMILNKLKKSVKIYARKCNVVEISNKVAKDFLNTNHIAGYHHGIIKLGLYHGEELMHVMVIGKSRFSKLAEYEIIRSATKLNHIVIGGLSKCIKYISKPLVSYVDLRYGNGNAYTRAGMKYHHTTSPGYCYYHDGKLISRLHFQKHKIPNILPNYDSKLTINENMENNGLYKIHNSGNKVFVLPVNK